LLDFLFVNNNSTYNINNIGVLEISKVYKENDLNVLKESILILSFFKDIEIFTFPYKFV